ncbi:MAG: MotA/TolQ/ExbB proton channel family protein [Verrucomicrobiales bacterium]
MSFLTRILLVNATLLGAASAQAKAPDAESGELTLLEIIEETGFLIWPLAALSITAVFLIIFYLLTVRRGAVVSDRFMNSADALIRKQDYLGLLEVCNRQDECISRITAKTLNFATKNPTASFAEVREVTEAEGSRQASILHQRIQYLADIGAIAPMVGLLGTVIGMIKAFREIAQHSFVGSKQTGLASGVSEALLTTAGGLCIGIPALIFYSMFRGRVQGLVSELEAAATHIMALLAAQYKQATSRATSGSRSRPSRNSPEEKPGNFRNT